MRKKNRKNLITIGMMTTSIMLLILLQFFWLRNSYDKARLDLSREANIIFRTTILDMWDSLVAQSIRQIPSDSSITGRNIFIGRKDSAVSIARIENNVTRHGTRDSSSLRVILSTTDSVVPRDVLKPLASRMAERPGQRLERTFIIQLGSDTLDRVKVRRKLSEAFLKAGVDTDFILHTSSIHDHALPDVPVIQHRLMMRKQKVEAVQLPSPGNKTGIWTESLSLDPMHEYSAELFNIQAFLLGRISPEIFFSIILTTIIGSAFAFMYRSIRTQQRLVESKNDFINNVTHELKTPVSTVSVALEAIQNFQAGSNPHLAKEYLEIARRELARLDNITDRILKTSVIENETASTTEQSDLNNVIRNVIHDKKIILEQRAAEVAYELDGSDFSIYCGSHQIYHLVENLLDNALKYSPDRPQITIKLTGSPSSLELVVTDNGIGIPREYQDRIFDKFFRVPTGDVHTVKGYGLGLSYVKTLVRSLGGNVNVSSEAGKGTSFNLTFPRRGKDTSTNSKIVES